MYTREEAEGKRLKNPFDTITEGIGINRLTQNFKLALLDGAFQGTDREAVEMARLFLTHVATGSKLKSLFALTSFFKKKSVAHCIPNSEPLVSLLVLIQ